MSDLIDKNNKTSKVNNESDMHISDSSSLDDEQRVKVLSPSMLVIKRFIRNRLAIIGFIIILFMFLFSFAGGLISPYKESEVFKEYTVMNKNYANAAFNKNYIYTPVAEGTKIDSSLQGAMIKAINENKTEFKAGNNLYILENEGNDFYKINVLKILNTLDVSDDNYKFGRGKTYTQFQESTQIEIIKNIESEVFKFDIGNDTFLIRTDDNLSYRIYSYTEFAIASHMVFDPYNIDINVTDYTFRYAAEKAINTEGMTNFTADNKSFEIEEDDESYTVYLTEGETRTPYANFSRYIVSLEENGILDFGLKEAVRDAIDENNNNFIYDDVNYSVTRINDQFTIKSEQVTYLIKIYDVPTSSHWLGTDANGMDILTRLMYGGRISLSIGFIVIAIEIVLGVILGGISGYFGGFIDNVIMRIVDIFNCIPSLPLIIILGAFMDQMGIDVKLRIYYLMFIMGILGWPGIARIVRAQILSLRSQDFMIAAEASGLTTYRKIFKHLVPNVIPQLIVMATMGLGGVILTESTLSFFGLGVKYPYASWGNIMNAVSNVHVMTNYWFVWIPAGLLILLTVLAFNFIGDGLRDAFDPKMKR